MYHPNIGNSMKKSIMFSVCFLLVAATLWAQEEYRKPTVLVAGFKHAGNVSSSEAETLRNSIISSLSRQHRIRLIDLNTETTLSEEQKRRLNEATMDDLMANGGEEMQRLVADYIIVGTASNVMEETKESKSKDGKVTYSYEATLTFAIQAIASKDGAIAYSGTLTNKESDDNKQKARADAFKTGLGCGFVEHLAPLEGEVYEGDYTEKKDKMLTCYIKLGAMHGVAEGDYFEICKVKYVAGEALYEEVGSLEVTTAHNKISECKVRKKGAEDVLAAMKQYLRDRTLNPEAAKPLMVRSGCKPSSGLFGLGVLGL